MIYRFAVPRYRVNFIKPCWGLKEFFCWLFYRQRDSSNAIRALIENFRHKLDITGIIIPTSSGRIALELALRVLKNTYPTKQKVMIPTYGCEGTFNPVINAGLTPVFADIDKNLNISKDWVSRHLGDDVLAILVPHLGGCKAEIDAILAMAKERHVVVIEDVCHALGARDSRGFLGTRGDMAIFSFGMGKNLMASAGGILTSNILKEHIEKEAQNLGKEDNRVVRRRFGRLLFRYFLGPDLTIRQYALSSYKYNQMHPLDAQLVCLQLDKLEDVLKKRRENAESIIEALLKTGLRFSLQDGRNHIYTKLIVSFVHPEDCFKLKGSLHKAGIETEGMYVPLHLGESGAEYYTGEGLPYSEAIYRNVFNIPVRPNLSESQLNEILKAIGSVTSE